MLSFHAMLFYKFQGFKNKEIKKDTNLTRDKAADNLRWKTINICAPDLLNNSVL